MRSVSTLRLHMMKIHVKIHSPPPRRDPDRPIVIATPSNTTLTRRAQRFRTMATDFTEISRNSQAS